MRADSERTLEELEKNFRKSLGNMQREGEEALRLLNVKEEVIV